jgi:hypothetical protein
MENQVQEKTIRRRHDWDKMRQEFIIGQAVTVNEFLRINYKMNYHDWNAQKDFQEWARARKDYRTSLFLELRQQKLENEGKDTRLFEEAMVVKTNTIYALLEDNQKIIQSVKESQKELTKTQHMKMIATLQVLEDNYGCPNVINNISFTQNNTLNPEYEAILQKSLEMLKTDGGISNEDIQNNFFKDNIIEAEIL